MRCSPWFGLGVRHIQYVLMAVMNCMDFWMLEVNKAIYMKKDSDPDEEYIRASETGLKDTEKDLIYAAGFILFTIGRFSSVFIVYRVNNKYLLLGLLMVENLFGTTVVWFVKYAKFYGVLIFVALTSLTRSAHAPLMYNMLSKWMPPCEYTTTFCTITIIKEMFSFLLSHLIYGLTYLQCQVVSTLLTFVYFGWCGLFLIFGAESPQSSFLISKREWNYLSKTIGPRKKIHCKAKMPLKAMVLCCLYYAHAIFNYGKEGTAIVIIKGVSTLSATADITGTRIICLQSILVFYSICLLVACIYIDRAIAQEKIQPGPFRKVMTTVGCCGVAMMMILGAYVDSLRIKMTYLFLADCFLIIVHIVDPCILFELSPNYAVPVFCIFSSVRNLMLIGKYSIDSALHDSDIHLKRTNVTSAINEIVPDGLIYRDGLILFFANLIFIISGNIKLQGFDSYDTEDWRKESVISYP